MRITLITTIFLLILLQTIRTNGQPNYKLAPNLPTSNFYTIKQDFQNWIDSTGQPDSIKYRAAKHFDRFENFWSLRVGSQDSLENGSFSAYSKKFHDYWSAPVCTSSDASEWKPIGPYQKLNTSPNMGFVGAIWVDKTNRDFILIGGGRHGGIWRTTDGGNNWQCMTDAQRLPVNGLTSIAVSPKKLNGKNVIYATSSGAGHDGVSHYGLGILKSVDDGESWEVLHTFPSWQACETNNDCNRTINKIVVWNSGLIGQIDVLYASSNNFIHKSTDGGLTWTTPYQFQNTGSVVDLEIINEQTIIVSTRDKWEVQNNVLVRLNRAQVWLTIDGGNTWNEILGNVSSQLLPNLIDVAQVFVEVGSNNILYCYVYSGGNHIITESAKILQSANLGLSWTLNTNVILGMRLFGNTFKMSNIGNYAYWGGQWFYRNNIEASTGLHMDMRSIFIIEVNGSDYIYLGTDGGLMLSRNNGYTWESVNGVGRTGINNNEIHGFDIVQDHKMSIVVGLQDSEFRMHFNSDWKGKFGFSDGCRCVFDPNDPFTVYGIHGLGGLIYKFTVDEINSLVTPSDWTDPLSGYDHKRLYRPLVIDRFNSKILFAGLNGGKLNRTTSISSSGSPIWTTCSIPGVNSYIVDIVIIDPINPDPSNTNRALYATTSGIQWNNSTGGAIFYSDDTGDNWIDVSGSGANAIKNQWHQVSCITVNPQNPKIVWVGLAGTCWDQGQQKACNRVFRTNDATQGNNTIWVDMTQNLPSLPVTAIVHQPGTLNRVFVATDGGIFYWDGNDDPSTGEWKCFSKSFPIAYVTQLKINRKTQEIYASTYGRGIWKSKLPCIDGQQSIICDASTGNLTWNKDKYIGGEILIGSGYTLTITDDAIISMGENSKIVIMDGGKLVVNNATITSGCNGMWQGIELQGDYSELQSDAAKGVVELLNGAVIENAVIGISTRTPGNVFIGSIPGTGGIIRAENATFRNCQTAVQMYPFKNNGSNYATSIDKSYFRNCTFVTDDDFLLKGVTAPTHMNLDGIYQLRVEGCTFRNDETPPVPGYLYSSLKGTGIMALDASVVVTPLCTTQTVPCGGQIRNQFINLHNAIHITQPLTTQGYSTLIKEADFTGNYRAVYANSPQLLQVKQCSLVNNYRGVYLLNSQGAMVEVNYVEIAEEYETTTLGYPYGLYLDAGHGFSVEGNNFSSAYPGTASYGILVNNTGAKNNEIYRNTFTGLKVGIQPQFRNKGKINNEDLGLCLFCNEFENPDTWDIWVGGKSIATHKKNIGINVSQQIRTWNNTTNQWDPYPAGNLFSPGHLNLPQNPNADNDFSNFDADYLSYAYDPGSSNGRMEPLVYSNIILFPRQSGATQCMTKTGNINNLTQGYASLASAQVALNSSRLILDIWKNGGIEDLEEQVELVLPWEVYQQYNELMSISPYVAADALIAMIQNTSFTDLMVKLVCVANPQAARNDEVLGALYNRNPPMPEQYIEEILDESGAYSPLDELEANTAADLHLVRTIGDEIIRNYLADTANTWSNDSLSAFLSRRPSLEDRYVYAQHCLRNGQADTAQFILEDIPSLFSLEDREQIEHEGYVDVFDMLADIRANDIQPGDLSPEQTEMLLQMLATEGTVDKALAISVILWNDPAYEYVEPILEPAGSQLRKARPQKTVTNETIELMLYPIPAKDHFTVIYKVPDNLRNSLSIQVKDVSGRIVLKQPLPDNAFEYLFETVTLTRGIYTVMLLNSTGLLKSEKLVIIK